MTGDEIIWQDYNPYPNAQNFVDSYWSFIDAGNGAAKPFNPDEPIVAGMRQLLFLLSGSLRPASGSNLEFSQLAVTGDSTGTITHGDLQMESRSGGQSLRRSPTGQPYILAAHITGVPLSDETLALDSLSQDAIEAAEESEEEEKTVDLADTEEEATPELNVVVVADIDCLADPFFAIREMGDDDQAIVDWNFQNVTFVLNVLDALAGDDRFLEVRKRTRQHRLLSKIEQATEDYREDALDQRSKFINDAKSEIGAVQQEFMKKIAEIEAREDLTQIEKRQRVDQARVRFGRSRDVKIAALEKSRDRQIRQGERNLESKIRGVQDFYKMCAVVLPPIPPILLAFLVFFHRRESEREGVAKTRLRYGGPVDEKAE